MVLMQPSLDLPYYSIDHYLKPETFSRMLTRETFPLKTNQINHCHADRQLPSPLSGVTSSIPLGRIRPWLPDRVFGMSATRSLDAALGICRGITNRLARAPQMDLNGISSRVFMLYGLYPGRYAVRDKSYVSPTNFSVWSAEFC